MNQKFVFDIPIYACTEEADRSIMAQARKQVTDRLEEMGASEEIIRSNLYYHDRKSEGPWRFNRIIGWLRLWVSERNQWGAQIRAELWHVDAKRIYRTLERKRFFAEREDVLQLLFDETTCSEAIFNQTLTAIHSLTNEGRLSKRFVDVSVFEAIGRHIDWKGLLGF